MASPEEIFAFIDERVSLAEDGSFRLNIKLENEGRPLTFNQSIDVVDNIREIIGIIVANHIFMLWISGQFSDQEVNNIYLRDYFLYISRIPDFDLSDGVIDLPSPQSLVLHEQRLAYGLGTIYDIVLNAIGLDIHLDAIYHENPNWIKIILSGGAFVLGTTIGGLAIAAAYQAYGAGDCRRAHLLLAQYQSDRFFDQARLQGRWTPEMRDSYNAAMKSSISSAESCNVLFNRIQINPRKMEIIIEKK